MLRNYLKAIILALKLPGPSAVPLLVMRNYVSNAFSLYGPLIRVWVLLFPFFVVLQPDDLQLILASKKHTNKTFFYRLMHNFLGNGLITRNGEQWQTHRRLIQPTFHLNFLERFISTFADASQSLFESLNPLDNQEINITKYINNCVLDILNEAVLGIPVKNKKYYTDMGNSPFRQWLQIFFDSLGAGSFSDLYAAVDVVDNALPVPLVTGRLSTSCGGNSILKLSSSSCNELIWTDMLGLNNEMPDMEGRGLHGNEPGLDAAELRREADKVAKRPKALLQTCTQGGGMFLRTYADPFHPIAYNTVRIPFETL
uniref:Cytochrome P450 n=1 Tax=Glossina brevipalpis TaxID=37001 RepID=A0A1A9W2D7_9MUSC